MGKKINYLTTNDESQIITQFKVSPLKESITKSPKKKRIHLNSEETLKILELINSNQAFQEIQKEYPNLSQTKYYDLKNKKPLKKDKLKEIHNHAARWIIEQLKNDPDYQELMKIENGFDLKSKISKLIREYLEKNQSNEKLNIRNTKEKISEEVFRLIARDGIELQQQAEIEVIQIDQQFDDLISEQIGQKTPPKGVKKSSKDPYIRGRIVRLKKEKKTPTQIREELNIDFPNSTIRSIKKPYCRFKFQLLISDISIRFDEFFGNLKEFHIVGQIIGPTNDLRKLRSFIKNIISPFLRSRKMANLLKRATSNCSTTIYRITKKLCQQFLHHFYPEPKPEIILSSVDTQLFIVNAALQYLQNFTNYDMEDEASLGKKLDKLITNWCSAEHSIFKHLKPNLISLEQQNNIAFQVFEKYTKGKVDLCGRCNVVQRQYEDQERQNQTYNDETETEDDDVEEQQIRNYSKYKYGYPLED